MLPKRKCQVAPQFLKSGTLIPGPVKRFTVAPMFPVIEAASSLIPHNSGEAHSMYIFMFCAHAYMNVSDYISNGIIHGIAFLFQTEQWLSYWVDLCGSTMRLYRVTF